MRDKVLRALALVWILSLATNSVEGSVTLISKTSQPWTVDLTVGGTKFKTCFIADNYVSVASNINGVYILRQTEDFIAFSVRDATEIYAIGCASGRFDVVYSAGLTLFGLGLSPDLSWVYMQTDFLVASAPFVDFGLADYNFPEDFTRAYTYTDGFNYECRYYDSLGNLLIVFPILPTDICRPIGTIGSSFLLANVDNNAQNYTVVNSSNSGNPTIFRMQYSYSPDAIQETFAFSNHYYLTVLDTKGLFSIMYLGGAGSNTETVNGVISSSSMIFKSDVVLQYNGAIITGIVLQGGNLHILMKLQFQKIISRPYTDIIGLTETSLLNLVQLNETFFRVNIMNGTALNSIDFLLDNLLDSHPVAPLSSPVSSTIIVVSVNNSVTVDNLVLNQTTVLVVQNEAVVTVTNCVSLAGTLKYVLSQSQYTQLIANNTLDVLVLLTRCTNGSFDAIQVIAENQDDCVTLEAQPNRDPAQLTLLITAKQRSDCGRLIVDEPLLSTGAIIGIVIGCAAAVTLIIVLALYFSPVSARVFPYARRNK